MSALPAGQSDPRSRLRSFEIDAEEKARLRREFSRLEQVTPFEREPELAARVAALGIAREVGTVNDEGARFLFTPGARSRPVHPNSLRAELVTDPRGRVGVRIHSTETDCLELHMRGLRELLHPEYSFHPDGSVRELVVFPELVARILRHRGVELALVRSWGLNSIFGGFDPAEGFYQTNFWELENNDGLQFAHIVGRGQLAFLGTHDLIAHVAGLRAEAWPRLIARSRRVEEVIRKYFARVEQPSIAALILPYTAGVVLDDLGQPPTYDSPSHLAMLEALERAMELQWVPPALPTLLSRFPAEFQRIIEFSREKESHLDPARVNRVVRDLCREIHRHAVVLTAGAC